MVLVRALWVALLIFCLAIGVENALDPGQTWRPSWAAFCDQVRTSLHWYGAVRGAVYASPSSDFSYPVSPVSHTANFWRTEIDMGLEVPRLAGRDLDRHQC